MKKKFIFILLCLFRIIHSEASNNLEFINSSYLISLNICLENYKEEKFKKKNSIKIPIYYKGLCYEESLESIFSMINIETKDLIETIYIIVSPCINVLMKDEETIIKGFKVNKYDSKCYKLTLEQVIKEGIITYNWNIENYKVPDKIISPEDTILIQANKDSLRIAELEKNFKKPYPPKKNSENNDTKFLGMLFLPTIYIDKKKIKQKNHQVELSKFDMKPFNIPPIQNTNKILNY